MHRERPLVKDPELHATVPFPVFRVEADGVMICRNDHARRLIDCQGGCHLEKIFVSGEARDRLASVLEGDGSGTIHGLIPILSQAKVFAGALDKSTGLLWLIEETDGASRRTWAYSQLATLESDIARLQKYRSETDGLIRNVAHDLRSPIATALSFGELIEELFVDQLPNQAAEFLGHIRAALTQAIEIADDLLRYSKLDAPSGYHISLPSLGKELARDFFAEAPEGRLVQEWHVETIWADPVTLYRVLGNLVGNAIKFRREGVRLVVRLSSQVVDRRVRIEVEDNGSGIPQDDRERVFRRLEHTESDAGGYGIGLANVKKLVTRAGGDVGIDDGMDGGTKVWVELPLRKLQGSKDATALMTEAIMARARGDMAAAMERGNEAVKIRADDPGYWRILASIFQSAEQWDAAEQALQRAIQLHPTNPEYHVLLALHYHRRKEIDKAREQYTTALELDENDPFVLENYATWIATVENDLAEAAVLWKRALAQGSTSTSILLNLAEKALLDGKIEEAAAFMREVHLGEEPVRLRIRAQGLWIFLDLLAGKDVRIDSLARLIRMFPAAKLSRSVASYGLLRAKALSALSGSRRKLAITLLDVCERKEPPESLHRFLRETPGQEVGG